MWIYLVTRVERFAHGSFQRPLRLMIRSLWIDARQRRPLSVGLAVALAIQLNYSWVLIGGTGVVLAALVVAALTLRPRNRTAPWAHLRLPTMLVEVGAVVLTLYYLPLTHFNPEVNWAIGRGDGYAFPPSGEIDPAYLVLLFPMVELLVTLTIFGLFGGLALLLARRSRPHDPSLRADAGHELP
jgi:hypothetical protein